jgi:hypothetical protein
MRFSCRMSSSYGVTNMNASQLFQILHDNFTPILGGITVISFVMNILQYKTNKNSTFFLQNIYQTCIRTIRMNEKREKSNDELIHLFYLIRDQSVSGLRSCGVKMGYGSYDQVTTRGYLYRFCSDKYILIMKIREKLPTLIKSSTKLQGKQKN